jgi:hypothetical protein
MNSGAVLAELGRYHEGDAPLRTVVLAYGSPQLLPLLFLARAEHALGNAAAARRLLVKARVVARACLRGRVKSAWLGLIQREVRELRSRRSHPRRPFGRRVVRGQRKLLLPRPRMRPPMRRNVVHVESPRCEHASDRALMPRSP